MPEKLIAITKDHKLRITLPKEVAEKLSAPESNYIGFYEKRREL